MMLKDLYINHKRAPYILKGELFTPSTIKEHYISSKETYEHQLPAPSLSFSGGLETRAGSTRQRVGRAS